VHLKTIKHSPDILESRHSIKNIFIGLIDGLTIPLALAAGLSGLVNSSSTVIIACIATTFAGSLTMTFGGYVEGRKYQDTFKPLNAALIIGTGYLAGGLITTIPYFFFSSPTAALPYSVLITLTVLLIAGYWESTLNGAKGLSGAIRVCITGAVAAGAAFIAAKLFS
jgi:VIT1/CCC1 family predicted Fe2+/Mn2+ transporter